jgi:hypothetical protein
MLRAVLLSVGDVLFLASQPALPPTATARLQGAKTLQVT